MGMSNYSNFIDGVTIRDVPIQQLHPGKVFWVNNSSVLPPGGVGGSDSNTGTYLRPFSTVDYAIGRCVAGRGDIIAVMPSHAETISGASGITQDVAGVAIVGLGDGSNRPTFTYSATASTWVISANNCSVKNIVVTPSIDSVVTAISVSGADCYLGIESQDATVDIEFVNVITTTAAADRIKIDLKHRGFTAGNAGVKAIALVGADNADIDVDFYGSNSTAVVNMLTTACLGVKVRGVFHNGVTALTKNVVDTVGTSKWIVKGLDEVGGYQFVGGSGAAVAALTSASTVGLGTDGTTVTDSATTVLGAIGANNADNAFSSTLVVANGDGSTLERLETLQAFDLNSGETTVKGTALPLPATGNTTIMTIAGGPIEIQSIIGEVTTVIQTQACTLKITAVDTVSSTATDICAVNANISAHAVGSFYNITGTFANALVNTAGGTAIAQAGKVVVPAGVLRITTNATNTGNIRWTMRYKPLSTGVTVTAA